MFPCQSCTRHVRDDARTCPFCGFSLRSGPSPIHGGFMVALLGLTLVSCGDPDPGDEEGASTVANTSNAATATESGSTTTEGSEATATESGSTTTEGSEAEAADYGTAEPPADSTSSSGTDSGSSTDGGQEGEAADYGGPEGTG